MKEFVCLAGALFLTLAVQAQNVNELAVEKQFPGDSTAIKEYQTAVEKQLNQSSAVRTTWVANKPSSNWFFSLEGGMAWLGSENFREIDLKDNLFPTGGFSVGKWFSPVWGLRVNATGSKLESYANNAGGTWYVGQNHANINGIKSTASYVTGDNEKSRDFIKHRFLDDFRNPYKNGCRYDLTYAGASLDFLLNLKNLFSPYHPDAFLNPVIHTGLGYAHTFKDGDRTAVNSFMGKGGLQLNFRLNDQLNLYIDGEALIVPEVFDLQLGGNRVHDIILNAKIGITYHFDFCHFIKAPL
jgi:hypothetical protein